MALCTSHSPTSMGEADHSDLRIHQFQSDELPAPPGTSSRFDGPLTQQPESEQTYPEGGRQAWLVVFGSFCAMVAALGIMNTIGTFQAYLTQNQLREHSEGQIGWIFGAYVFICFFGGIQVVTLVASLILLSVSKYYWQFMLSFGVLAGLGTSLIFTPAVTTIGHWFLTRRAYVTGLSTTGGSIGGVIFPLLIQFMVPRVGFGWAVRIVALISLSLLVVAIFLVRGRVDHINTPEPHSLESPPAASPPALASEKETLGWLGSFRGDPKEAGKGRTKRSASLDLTCFRDSRFTLTTIGIFMIEWGLFVPLTYITSYTLSYLHLPPSFSYQLLAILNTGSAFGRFLPGIAADKFGRFNAMIVTVAFCLVVTLGLWLPSGRIDSRNVGGRKSIMTAFAFLYGFGSGSGISLSCVCIAQISETRDYGKRYGTCYFFVSFGILMGLPLAGQIVHSMGGDFTGLILFTAASYLVALVFFIAARIVAAGASLKTVF